MKKTEIILLLQDYNTNNEFEVKCRDRIIDFIKNNDVYLGKGNSDGHLTGSAWIVNADKSKILLTHHKKLDKWLQLGGHTEENENLLQTALREAMEESGLSNVKVISDYIFDMDVHLIPSRKNEKEHFHYDIRFLFEADESENIEISHESKDLKWVSIEEISSYSKEESIHRMIRKTLKLKE